MVIPILFWLVLVWHDIFILPLNIFFSKQSFKWVYPLGLQWMGLCWFLRCHQESFPLCLCKVLGFSLVVTISSATTPSLTLRLGHKRCYTCLGSLRVSCLGRPLSSGLVGNPVHEQLGVLPASQWPPSPSRFESEQIACGLQSVGFKPPPLTLIRADMSCCRSKSHMHEQNKPCHLFPSSIKRHLFLPDVKEA